MRTGLGHVLAIVGILITAMPTPAAEGPSEPWFGECSKHSRLEARVAEQRWRDLETELLTKSQSQWAGLYVSPEGLTRAAWLIWTPHDGYVAAWTDCCPGVVDLNYGTIDQSSHGIELKPTLGERRRASLTIASEMLFVKWGERHYLIPKARVADFCDYAAGFDIDVDEDLKGQFLVRHSDRDLPYGNLPEVPAGYEQFVKKPISARVKLNRLVRSRNVALVTISAGSRDGVRPGMIFYSVGPRALPPASIVDVAVETSTAEIFIGTETPRILPNAVVTSRPSLPQMKQ